MLSRWLCIVVLMMLMVQVLLMGGLLTRSGAAWQPAWERLKRLLVRLRQAAEGRMVFSFRSPRQRRKKRRWRRRRRVTGGGHALSATREAEAVSELSEPPGGWPGQMLDLMDAGACRAVIQAARWAGGVGCVHCGGTQVEVLAGQMTSAGWQRYACPACRTARGHPKTFSDLSGTPWESCHLDPARLLYSLSSFVEGHSAAQMARQLGVQGRTGQRLRRLYQVVLYLNRPVSPLTADVEVDEVYLISGWKGTPNGLKPNRPPRRRRLKGKRGRGTWESDKVPLVAIVQRQGQIRLLAQRHLRKDTFRPLLKRWVQRGANVYTDDYDIYHFLSPAGFRHQSVNHSQGEYARGKVHINTAEAVFSLVRPYLATFRGVSKVYLPLYAGAFEFIYNHRHLSTWQQAGALLQLLFQTDGPTVRQAVRNTEVVELCDLPT